MKRFYQLKTRDIKHHTLRHSTHELMNSVHWTHEEKLILEHSQTISELFLKLNEHSHVPQELIKCDSIKTAAVTLIPTIGILSLNIIFQTALTWNFCASYMFICFLSELIRWCSFKENAYAQSKMYLWSFIPLLKFRKFENANQTIVNIMHKFCTHYR